MAAHHRTKQQPRARVSHKPQSPLPPTSLCQQAGRAQRSYALPVASQAVVIATHVGRWPRLRRAAIQQTRRIVSRMMRAGSEISRATATHERRSQPAILYGRPPQTQWAESRFTPRRRSGRLEQRPYRRPCLCLCLCLCPYHRRYQPATRRRDRQTVPW